MSTRGENLFSRLPAFAARLYDWLTYWKGGQHYFADMTDRLAAVIFSGQLLEVGFGPDRLLHDLHQRQPNIHLSGIDLSAFMIEVAKKNLAGVSVELKQGSIEKTDYPDTFFDLVNGRSSLNPHSPIMPNWSASLWANYRYGCKSL